MKRIIVFLLFIANLLSIGGCNSFKAWFAREFIQGTVADGLARLSVQPMAIITGEINAHFDDPSASVKITPSLEPKQFGKGHVSWTVKNFDIIYEQEKAVYTDCHGEQGFWRGKAHVLSATRTMYGRLTNDPKQPVIPDPGTVVVDVHVEVENLSIRFPSKEGYLVMDQGEFKFKAIPRLAQHTNGMRITPTSNIKISDVKITKIIGILKSQAVDMPVEIEEAFLNINIGPQDDGQENSIAGTIKVFGNTHHVPSDGKGLDPDYDAEKFMQSYSCHKDLAHGVSFNHIPVENQLAHGVAGLTTQLMGLVAAKLEDHDGCGMASVATLRQGKLRGLPGGVGTLELKLPHSCSLDFINEQTKPDCFGRAHFINGRVTVTKARRILHGMVIATEENYREATRAYSELFLGDDDKRKLLAALPIPIIPLDPRSAELGFEATFYELRVKDICIDSNNSGHKNHCRKQSSEGVTFRVSAGKVSADFNPVLAKDVDPNSLTNKFCAAKTPMAEAKLILNDMKVSIERSGMKFELPAEGTFNIVSGKIGDQENQLRGGLKIGSFNAQFKTADKNFLALDPNYERQLFIDSFSACQPVVLIDNPNQCRIEEALAANIGRLIVLNAGSLLKISTHKKIPGSLASFTAPEALALLANRVRNPDPTNITLNANINAETQITGADLANLISDTDGLNNKTTIKGYVANVQGTMVRQGVALTWLEQGTAFTANGVENLLVRPITSESTTINITNARVRDFSTEFSKAGQSPEPRLDFKQGLFQIRAKPFLGLHRSTAADLDPNKKSYSVQTPVINFEEIKLERAFVQLKSDKMTIPLYINQANIKAFNGRFLGQGNYIEGDISFVIIQNPNIAPAHFGPTIIIESQKLQPDYHQESFDASYRNTANLHSVLPAN